MSDKKEYSAREVAEGLIKKAREIATEQLAKAESVKQAVKDIKGPAKLNEVLPKVPADKRDDVLRELRSDMNKMAPENKTSAQMAGVKVPQPKPPSAQPKAIAKQPLQLKKFMEKCSSKKMQKNEAK